MGGIHISSPLTLLSSPCGPLPATGVPALHLVSKVLVSLACEPMKKRCSKEAQKQLFGKTKHIEDEAVAQDLGTRRVVVSVCSPSSINQSCMSRLWLHAGKQSKESKSCRMH